MRSAFPNAWQITDTQQTLQNLSYHKDVKWEMSRIWRQLVKDKGVGGEWDSVFLTVSKSAGLFFSICDSSII